MLSEILGLFSLEPVPDFRKNCSHDGLKLPFCPWNLGLGPVNPQPPPGGVPNPPLPIAHCLMTVLVSTHRLTLLHGVHGLPSLPGVQSVTRDQR